MDYPKVILSGGTSLSINIDWPKRVLPASFQIETDKFQAWGLIVDYDAIGPDKLSEMLYAGQEQKMSFLSSDFLIILLTKDGKKAKIMASLSGMFPVFFTKQPNQMVISPHFGEVIKSITNIKLDTDELLDYLCTEYSIFFTDKTFVSQIKRLPPGCILEVKNDLSYQIKEPFSWTEALKDCDQTPLQPKEFVDALITKLEKSLTKRVACLKSFPSTCDLSSGFDSSLTTFLLKKILGNSFVCYSLYTKLNSDDTDPTIVQKFAGKYCLNLQMLDTSNIVAFYNDEDLNWTQNMFFPGGHYQPIGLGYERKKIMDLGLPLVSYTGFGGDEFFHSKDIIAYTKSHKQAELDFAQLISQSDGDKILTSEGLSHLTDQERFNNKRLYSNQYGSATVGWLSFPVVWRYQTWLVFPFADIELIKLAQRMPRQGNNILHKQEIFKGNTDIFLAEQYRQKLPFDSQIKSFMDNRRELIIKIMQNSILGKIGLVKTDEIIRVAREGKLKEYIGQMHLMLINLLRLEIFLQANKILLV